MPRTVVISEHALATLLDMYEVASSGSWPESSVRMTGELGQNAAMIVDDMKSITDALGRDPVVTLEDFS